MNQQIERISHYEAILQKAEQGTVSRDELRELEAYYTSEEWKQDFAADEAGLLPADLKRGVLSEDGIYNVLETHESPVDEYLASQPQEIQPILASVRETIREALPDAEERISYQMPTWWKQRNRIHFAAQKKHVGIYPGPEAVEHFTPVLDERKLKHSKGAIQFPYDRIDLDLIAEIAEWCGRNNG